MSEGYWVIRTWVSGAVGEKTKFWVPGVIPPKGSRRLKTEADKRAVNESNATRRLARLLNENFPKADGCLLGLDYTVEGLEHLGDAGQDGEEWANELFHRAHHQLRLWLRRVRRACQREGVELRYIATTSDMDGETGEYVRVHHHVVINREAAEVAVRLGKWTLGGVDREGLWDELDHTRLAAYLMDQVRRLPDEKKYIPSRNLRQPKPKDRIAKSGAELTVPRGGRLLYRQEFRTGAAQYIRYLTPKALGTEPVAKRE